MERRWNVVVLPPASSDAGARSGEKGARVGRAARHPLPGERPATRKAPSGSGGPNAPLGTPPRPSPALLARSRALVPPDAPAPPNLTAALAARARALGVQRVGRLPTAASERPTAPVPTVVAAAPLRGPRQPMVVYTDADGVAARRAAEALRERGADVALVQCDAGSLCATHPSQLCDALCSCGRRVCPGCRLVAGGAARCAACDGLARRAAGRRRIRQLFALLAFVVFLHQALGWDARERELVNATGPVRVAIVQLVRPEAAHAPLVAAMNGPQGLAAIGPWLEEERARYLGARPGAFQVDVLGPWVEDVRPPTLPPREPSLLDALRVSLQFPRYFHDLARTRGVNPDAYGARVYVVYGAPEGDLSGDSRGSRKGRLAVSFVPTDASLAYAQITVAHELAHVLGARDHYVEETYLARFPEGYVEPWADPPYPQRYAELMAVDVPVTPSSERDARSLAEVRIGYQTAAELGWIEQRQADHYNTPALRAPELQLVRAAVGTR